MKNIIIKLANVSCIIIIILLSIFAILQFTQTIYILQVRTGSMENEIHAGDYIIVKKQKKYEVGDIVTYMYNDNYITHRISKIDNDKIITKGDANNTDDESIEKDMIIGKVIYKSMILNYIIKYKVIISIVFIIFFIVSCIIGKTKDEETEIKEKIEVI